MTTWADADLGSVWRELERAMPPGWRGPTLTRTPTGYRAEAYLLAATTGPHAYVTRSEYGVGRDPVTALERLAERLWAAQT